MGLRARKGRLFFALDRIRHSRFTTITYQEEAAS
jgi:hypothetical protein